MQQGNGASDCDHCCVFHYAVFLTVHQPPLYLIYTYAGHQKDRQCGPRILTVFMYLNDVEAGGGTRFTDLDLTVMPKVGRVLIWPSVYDSDPMVQDPRMMHEAMAVEAGVKFGANGWIHMYDYLGPQSRGCN